MFTVLVAIIFVVIFPSTLSNAVAPESTYVVPIVTTSEIFPITVMTGGVVSGVVVEVVGAYTVSIVWLALNAENVYELLVAIDTPSTVSAMSALPTFGVKVNVCVLPEGRVSNPVGDVLPVPDAVLTILNVDPPTELNTASMV